MLIDELDDRLREPPHPVRGDHAERLLFREVRAEFDGAGERVVGDKQAQLEKPRCR